MKIKKISLQRYTFTLTNKKLRSGVYINIENEKGEKSSGDIAPLPGWSKETLDDALREIDHKHRKISEIKWNYETCLQELSELQLLPSVLFGLESAILSLVDPLPSYTVEASALLMGTPKEILDQAYLRHREGYKSAKLKISHLTFDEAKHVIYKLKDQFRLRIDVNRAWSTEDALKFFSEFPFHAFDYIEEPFQYPHDLKRFLHPLAIDESYSLVDLDQLPSLKTIVYKPMIRGGILECLKLHKWAQKRGINLVLSSSFESILGLAQITSMAYRLNLLEAIGIGTYHLITPVRD